MRRFFQPALLMLLLPAMAVAQEELLWRAESPVSATLPPAYGGWKMPFSGRPKTEAGPSSADLESKRKAEAEAAAQNAARIKADAEATAKAAAERAALQKATVLAGRLDAVAPNFENIKLDGIVQGPLGNSMLLDGKWLAQGSQIALPAQIGPKMSIVFSKLETEDALAAGYLKDKLQERLNHQATISLTLVQVLSDTAIFGNGQQKYKLQLSQPPL